MGAFMDTRGLVREGVWIVGGVMVASVLMLGLIAWAHDGEVANTIINQLIGVIEWGMPLLVALLIGNQGAAALVAIKGNTAPAPETPQATPQPAPIPAPVAVPAVALAGDL